MKPGDITQLFDEFLKVKELKFEAIIIGGAALALQKVISRETIDIDCLDPKIPTKILEAAAKFRSEHPELLLAEKWLNNGPDSLVRDLPKGWRERSVSLYKGKAIHFFTLGRNDLLKTKLYAYCDRGDDFNDCLALKPSAQELDEAYEWVAYQDTNPLWPEHVKEQFSRLKRALKNG